MKRNIVIRFPFGEFGPKINPVGEYVSMQYNNRALLGKGVSIDRDEILSCWFAVVKHFNGEPWPIKPALINLRWLKQDK